MLQGIWRALSGPRAAIVVTIALVAGFGVAGSTLGAEAASAAANTLAGYTVTPAGLPESGSVSFTVPMIMCPAVPKDPQTVLAGIAEGDNGASDWEAVVALTCSAANIPSYTAETVIYDACTGTLAVTPWFGVSPGQSMDASVSTTGHVAVATITDVSTGQSGSASLGCEVGYGMNRYGMFCPTNWNVPSPVCTGSPKFSTVTFTNALADGHPIGTYANAASAMPWIVPGPLSAGGSSFVDTFV
jgi:hypothetical protein